MTKASERIRHHVTFPCCFLEVGTNNVHAFMPKARLENGLVIGMNMKLGKRHVANTAPSS